MDIKESDNESLEETNAEKEIIPTTPIRRIQEKKMKKNKDSRK